MLTVACGLKSTTEVAEVQHELTNGREVVLLVGRKDFGGEVLRLDKCGQHKYGCSGEGVALLPSHRIGRAEPFRIAPRFLNSKLRTGV